MSTGMSRVAGFVRLIRPVNCLMMGFAVMVGASLVMESPLSTDTMIKLLLGYVTAFTLTGASMAVNDYYDREIDRINEPERPIPSGLVKPQESVMLAAILTAVGLAAASLTNPLCLITAISSWLVSVTYVTVGKRTGLPGNFLVSACVSIPFIYGGFIIDQGIAPSILFFAALAFLSNTGREVVKGIVDIEGDRSRGVRTVAVSYGERAAAYMASTFILSAVILSFLPLSLGFVARPSWFIPLITVADLGFAASSAMLIRDQTRENAKRMKNLLLLWMAISLIAFLAGGSTG